MAERGVERIVLSPDWQKIAGDALRPKLESLSSQIVGDIATEVPRRTGRLALAAFSRIATDGSSVEIGVRRAQVIYGRWVEYGTRRSKANPFLHRAIQAALQQVKPTQ